MMIKVIQFHCIEQIHFQVVLDGKKSIGLTAFLYKLSELIVSKDNSLNI